MAVTVRSHHPAHPHRRREVRRRRRRHGCCSSSTTWNPALRASRAGWSTTDALHRFVNVYVNDEDVRFAGGLDAAVHDGDTVTILPAVAGGCAAREWEAVVIALLATHERDRRERHGPLRLAARRAG